MRMIARPWSIPGPPHTPQLTPLRFANAVGVAAQICLCQAMAEAQKKLFNHSKNWFFPPVYLDWANLATVHHLLTLKCVHRQLGWPCYKLPGWLCLQTTFWSNVEANWGGLQLAQTMQHWHHPTIHVLQPTRSRLDPKSEAGRYPTLGLSLSHLLWQVLRFSGTLYSPAFCDNGASIMHLFQTELWTETRLFVVPNI